MIRLNRVRTNAAVHANFRGPKRLEYNLELLQLKRDGKLEENVNKVLSSAVWGKAKDQLLAESFDKCAYCETPTAVVAYGDVEHFRPKSVYWWLAYCYENYLASCVICNQRYKKDNFKTANPAMKGPVVKSNYTDTKLNSMAPAITVDPVDDAAGMSLAELEEAMSGEFPLLIHPYFEDPAEYLAYQPILANKEVVVVPTRSEYAPVVEACESYFGINRKELMDLRFEHYCTYMTFKHTLTLPGLPAHFKTMLGNRIHELQADGSRYAGMIRYLETQPLASLPWDFNLEITF